MYSKLLPRNIILIDNIALYWTSFGNKGMSTEQEIAEIATLILRDGDRFCGAESQKRKSAIRMALDGAKYGLTVSVIATQQIESRKAITSQEVKDFLNWHLKFFLAILTKLEYWLDS